MNPNIWWAAAMSLLAVNASGTTPALAGADADAEALAPALSRHLAALPPRAPVVVLVHGYSFSPRVDRHDPHRHILSLTPDPDCWKAVSWPRHLGFGRSPGQGLAIAFGWEARGTLWRAGVEALRAGRALARLVALIRRLRPGAPVDLVGHSLGARVALSALPRLEPGDVGRIVLMAGAEFRRRARAAMDSPAGRTAEVLNVTSRENDPFDLCVELLLGAGSGRTLGHGLGRRQSNWLDLQIDDPASLAALRRLGFRVAAPAVLVCHWSPYLRPGLFPLYRAMLHDRARWPLGLLAAALPATQAPRWSRLLGRPSLPPPLPLRRNASS